MSDRVSSQNQHICPACRRPLRPEALFCTACGYSERVKPASDIPQYVKSTALFATHWLVIKSVGWLFGLLLLSLFVGGEVTHVVSSPWIEVIITGINALIILGFVLWRFRDISSLLVFPKLKLRLFLELSGMAILFMAVSAGYFVLLERTGVPIGQSTAIFSKYQWPVWSMYLMISVFPGIFEELAFRGYIQTELERILGEYEAWLIQAALFSVLHLLPLMFPSHFLMGLCFGFMRLRSKSIYPGMLLHASWNALVLFQELK